MQVKLIAKTVGVGELEGMSVGEILAYVARVSNPSGQMNNETAPKLLNFCLKNQHWSVFETAYLTMEITTSRAIAQQLLRHRSMCAQEFSQRYSVATEFETYPARRQDTKNRQNSVDDMSDDDKEWFISVQEQVQSSCQFLYEQALDRGIAKEQARFLLPLSTQTRLYMTGNIRSWLTYCKLRCGNGTQLEHREIALACRDILIGLCPEVISFFFEEEA